jgi:hypothetical protein
MEQIPVNFKIIFLATRDTYIKKPLQALRPDSDIILRPLDPLLFPRVSLNVEVNMGFAHEQARYPSPFPMTASHGNDDHAPKDREGNPLRRPGNPLEPRPFVRHYRRPLPRWGVLLDGVCLLLQLPKIDSEAD